MQLAQFSSRYTKPTIKVKSPCHSCMAGPMSVNKLNHQKPTDHKYLVFNCLATFIHRVACWWEYHFEDLLPHIEIALHQLHFTNKTIPSSLMLYNTSHFIRISYKVLSSQGDCRIKLITYLYIYIRTQGRLNMSERAHVQSWRPTLKCWMQWNNSVTTGKLITDTDTPRPYHKLTFHVLWQESLTTG